MQIIGPELDARSRCEAVLRTLPQWFGIEDALVMYADDTRRLPTFAVVDDDDRLIGFVSLTRHFDEAWEIHCIAIDVTCRNRGHGRALVAHCEAWLMAQGVSMLQVKTIAATSTSAAYAETRRFYEMLGFVPVEVFPTLWSPRNPCLQMIKRLSTRAAYETTSFDPARTAPADSVVFSSGAPADALCIGVLATQVFLDTYATHGVRADLAREALAQYGTQAFEQRLCDPACSFVLAERAGHLLGFAECSTSSAPPLPSHAGGIELVRLYVQRRAQRQGLGAALLRRAEALARPASPACLWLTSWSGNADARAFYAAQGYRDVGATEYVIGRCGYENRVFEKWL